MWRRWHRWNNLPGFEPSNIKQDTIAVTCVALRSFGESASQTASAHPEWLAPGKLDRGVRLQGDMEITSHSSSEQSRYVSRSCCFLVEKGRFMLVPRVAEQSFNKGSTSACCIMPNIEFRQLSATWGWGELHAARVPVSFLRKTGWKAFNSIVLSKRSTTRAPQIIHGTEFQTQTSTKSSPVSKWFYLRRPTTLHIYSVKSRGSVL